MTEVERVKAWCLKNPEKRRLNLERYYLKNKQLIINRSAERHNRLKKTEEYKQIRKAIEQRQKEKTPDYYCAKCLEQRGFSKDQITPDLIAAERALIKLKRAVKGIEA